MRKSPRDAASARAFFDAIARRYDRVYALSGEASKLSIARTLALLEGKTRVLVLGVGTGRELSALLDAGHAPTGLDVSPEMLASCNRRARPIPLVLGDLWSKLPLEDGAFDAAIGLHGTIAHAPAPEEASLENLASELGRVLAPSGAMVFEVPTRAMLAFMPNSLETEDGRSMTVDGDVITHRDTVTGATIDAKLLDAAAYEHAFARCFDVTIEPMDRGEIRLIGRRR
jgi:SAM-dependent methyltransferase